MTGNEWCVWVWCEADDPPITLHECSDYRHARALADFAAWGPDVSMVCIQLRRAGRVVSERHVKGEPTYGPLG